MGTYGSGQRIPAGAVPQLRAEAQRSRWLFWRHQVDAEPEQELFDLVERLARGGSTDLDKSWHVLHVLLAGTQWEPVPGAGEAVLGGEALLSSDTVLCLLPPEQVRRVDEHLRALDPAEVMRRYDPQQLNDADVHHGEWRPEDGPEFILPNLHDLVDLYREAARAGDAVVTTTG